MKKHYEKLDFRPIEVEVKSMLMECSVRLSETAVTVEDYHDYFFENALVDNLGSPFEITFGD